MLNKSVVYNLVGSVFDKGLPIIISALLTKFMTTQDYGKWSLLYTFILISNSFSASPILAIFARKFFKYPPDEQKMYLYFFKLVAILQILSLIVYYMFFSPLSYSAFLEIPALVLMNLYAYFALFLRFQGSDLKYMWHSLVRLIVFAAILLVPILILKKVSYSTLIAIFLISHIPSFIKTIKLLAISNESEKGDLKEFISLSAYGLSTSLVNGVDRFIMIASGYSLSFLGYYSFLYSIGNTPTIIVEAFKKTINPVMYKELSVDGKLSNSTKKNVFIICAILFVVQLTVPTAVYFILKHLNLINPAFIMDKAYIYIYILSIGFFFQGVYHFLNPYYFFFRKSGLLLLIQAICMGVYFLFIKYTSSPLDYSGFMWVKTGLLVSITLLLLLVKNNVNQEEKT